MEQLYAPEDGLRGSMKNGASILPFSVYNRLGTSKSSVHNWVVGSLEIGGLVVTDGLALPDQASLNRDVDVEANVIIDKAMGVCDRIRCLTS